MDITWRKLKNAEAYLIAGVSCLQYIENPTSGSQTSGDTCSRMSEVAMINPSTYSNVADLFGIREQQYPVMLGGDELRAAEFASLVKQWKRETGNSSVIARRYRHPAYAEILGMKEAAIPLILKELRRDPDRWFDALEKLTRQNPAKEAKSFYEAVDKWVSWGIANQHIT